MSTWIKYHEIEPYRYLADYIKKSNESYISNKTFPDLDFVYDNIILNYDKHLKFYKICPDKDIYMGHLEDYIESLPNHDQTIVVEVVVQCILSEVKSKVNRLIPVDDIKSISDITGKTLEDETSLNYIFGKTPNQKVFINLNYKENRDSYHKALIEKFFWFEKDSKNGWIENFNKNLKELRNKFKLFKKYLKCKDNNSMKNLKPEFFKTSKYFFCKLYSERLYEACKQVWKSIAYEVEHNNEDFIRVYYFIRMALMLELHEHNIKTGISSKQILIKALQRLCEKKESGKTFMKKFIHFFFIREIDPKSLETDIQDYFSNYATLNVKLLKSTECINIPLECTDLIELKKIVLLHCGTEEKSLYYVNNEENQECIRRQNKIGDTIYFYEISSLNETQRELKRGSFGSVHLYENKCGAKFVIKKYHKTTKDIEINREITINHNLEGFKELPKFIGLIMYEGNLCMELEYLEGESLRDKIKKAKERSLEFTEKETFKLVYDILIQLQTIHKWGIVHLDIKPANILFDQDQKASLCDFGLSLLVNSNTFNEIKQKLKIDPPGTLYYVAPEIKGKVEYSKKFVDICKVDIWSLGIVVIEIILGEVPKYIGDEYKNEVNFNFLKNASENYKDFLKKCLVMNPSQRASVEELLKLKYIN